MQQLFSIQKAIVRSANQVLFSDLSFTVKKGENWALTGPGGSGKSALLHTIAGNLSVSGGTMTHDFFDDYLHQHPQQSGIVTFQKLIAMVETRHHFKNLSNTSEFYYQQRYNSSDSEDALTVKEYLHSVKPVHNAGNYWNYNNTIAALHLTELAEKQLIKLSNGETKRLRIAAALLKNPVLLLLDNPLTGLDVQTRAEFNYIINEIIASGITVIMSTAADEIPDAITNVAILEERTIAWQGTKASFTQQVLTTDEQQAINIEALRSLIGDKKQSPYSYIINLKNINIKYGSNTVLNNVNWCVKPGERWALLGHNGAGKSTLLSLINGDNPQAYANDIVLFDRKRGSGESIWDIKKKTGFVAPELHQYFPTDNSCLQVIESGYYDTLGLFRPGNKAFSAIALQWMKALEIEKYARVLLKNVPAGAQRLCLLARALIKNPPLLIFDEPCQGMDSHQLQHFKKLIDTICGLSEVTLIYVTHYQHEIPDSVDKVLRLEKGEVI